MEELKTAVHNRKGTFRFKGLLSRSGPGRVYLEGRRGVEDVRHCGRAWRTEATSGLFGWAFTIQVTAFCGLSE